MYNVSEQKFSGTLPNLRFDKFYALAEINQKLLNETGHCGETIEKIQNCFNTVSYVFIFF